MTRREYELIQERLSRKLHITPTNDMGYPLSFKEREGYRVAILAAKSVVRSCYYVMMEEKA